MVSRHAVVAGASGFIGAALVKTLRRDGWRVTTLVRREPTATDEVMWNPASGELDPAVVSGADAVINLAGSSISRMPWTKAIKADLMESRRTTTTTIVTAINAAKATPKVFLSASAIGFYGHRGDEELTEKSKRGDGFLADVCVAWEKWASKATCRTVFLRTGLVLGWRRRARTPQAGNAVRCRRAGWKRSSVVAVDFTSRRGSRDCAPH
jgi:uncharacterized protein